MAPRAFDFSLSHLCTSANGIRIPNAPMQMHSTTKATTNPIHSLSILLILPLRSDLAILQLFGWIRVFVDTALPVTETGAFMMQAHQTSTKEQLGHGE